MDETTEGIKLGGEKISVLTFADDLVLLAKNKEIANEQNRLLYKYLNKLQMEVSADKCSTFQILQKNKTWFIRNPQLTLIDNQQRVLYAKSN